MASNSTSMICSSDKSTTGRARNHSSTTMTPSGATLYAMNKPAEKSQHIQVAVRVR